MCWLISPRSCTISTVLCCFTNSTNNHFFFLHQSYHCISPSNSTAHFIVFFWSEVLGDSAVVSYNRVAYAIDVHSPTTIPSRQQWCRIYNQATRIHRAALMQWCHIYNRGPRIPTAPATPRPVPPLNPSAWGSR
jgi:hypothetical protein